MEEEHAVDLVGLLEKRLTVPVLARQPEAPQQVGITRIQPAIDRWRPMMSTSPPSRWNARSSHWNAWSVSPRQA
jgi:hypothetical protein